MIKKQKHCDICGCAIDLRSKKLQVKEYVIKRSHVSEKINSFYSPTINMDICDMCSRTVVNFIHDMQDNYLGADV